MQQGAALFLFFRVCLDVYGLDRVWAESLIHRQENMCL